RVGPAGSCPRDGFNRLLALQRAGGGREMLVGGGAGGSQRGLVGHLLPLGLGHVHALLEARQRGVAAGLLEAGAGASQVIGTGLRHVGAVDGTGVGGRLGGVGDFSTLDRGVGGGFGGGRR